MTDPDAMYQTCTCTHFRLDHAGIAVDNGYDPESGRPRVREQLQCLVADCGCVEFTPVIPPPMTEADANNAFQAPPPKKLLSTRDIRMIGAMEHEETRAAGTAQFLADQRHTYEGHSKEHLIEELLRRDAAAINEGRALTDGRMAGRFLREIVRGILHTADAQDLLRIEGAGRHGRIQDVLEILGAECGDRRQIRTEGSLIGDVLSGEEDPEKRIEALSPEQRTTPRPDVAQDILNRADRALQIAKDQGGNQVVGDDGTQDSNR